MRCWSLGHPATTAASPPSVTRHILEVEVLEVVAPCGDRREPIGRHVRAVGEVEVLELGAPGGDRRDPRRP